MFEIFTALSLKNQVETAVRATLSDGQVLMGEVRTKMLRLTTGAGTIDIPLSDVGEVSPAEDRPIGTEAGPVGVWLRNGSELRGTWTDPKLAMDIAVGGNKVGVDLPMNELSRFQLQGGEAWPDAPVYRMRTSFGDDFLVDPSRTHLVVENQLGSFAPVLSDCKSVAPISDPEGDWRIELRTGTVLIGQLRDDSVTVALPMGPKEITVALENFVSLRLETWRAPQHGVATSVTSMRDDALMGQVYPVEAALASPGAPPPARELRKSKPAQGGRSVGAPSQGANEWFDSADLQGAKDESEGE